MVSELGSGMISGVRKCVINLFPNLFLLDRRQQAVVDL